MKKMDSNQIKNILTGIAAHGNYLSWLISVSILIAVVIFLTHSFVGALINLRALSNLKGQVALKVVDLKKWETVNQSIGWKQQVLQDGELENNPFE